MVRVKDNRVLITRGDSAYIKINPIGYELQDGDSVKLQVRDAPDRGGFIFEGEIVKIGDDIIWKIRPNDTEELAIETYYFDVEIDFANGDVFTYIPDGKLIIQGAVTEGGA